MSLPRGFNLNTVVTIAGFLATFTTIVTAWANLQNNQRNFGQFIEEQKLFNGNIDERFKAGGEKMSAIPILQADVARGEAANMAQDDRMSRMADSNGGQLADLRAGMATLNTQVALIKQSLDRLEASWPPATARRN
jgi:hypothetical protein